MTPLRKAFVRRSAILATGVVVAVAMLAAISYQGVREQQNTLLLQQQQQQISDLYSDMQTLVAKIGRMALAASKIEFQAYAEQVQGQWSSIQQRTYGAKFERSNANAQALKQSLQLFEEVLVSSISMMQEHRAEGALTSRQRRIESNLISKLDANSLALMTQANFRSMTLKSEIQDLSRRVRTLIIIEMTLMLAFGAVLGWALWWQFRLLDLGLLRRIEELSGAMASDRIQNYINTSDTDGFEFDEIEKMKQQLQELLSRLQAQRDELHRANESLRQTQQQLLQSEKLAAVGQLSAGVAHEINNPLGFMLANSNGLDGYIDELASLLQAYELASHSSDPALLAAAKQQAESLDLDFVLEDIRALNAESRSGLTRIARIVADLKDFAKPQEEIFESTDINQCIEQMLNLTHSQLQDRVEIVLDLPPLPAVTCVRQQIDQVFLNLLLNAAFAIKERGIITLSTRAIDAQGVSIEFKDNGSGMSAETLANVFDPFFTTKPVGTGTGLGLSVVYGIITKHGGTIEVESTLGEGSCFMLYLPFLPPRINNDLS